jgi:hypothetical protein
MFNFVPGLTGISSTFSNYSQFNNNNDGKINIEYNEVVRNITALFI